MGETDKIAVRGGRLSLGMAAFSLLPLCCPLLFGLGWFIHIAMTIGGLVTGIEAYRLIRADPETYSGLNWALAGIVVNALLIGSQGLSVALSFLP
jgi:hypothetical protein